jgi:HK97 family phage portal protein
VLHIPGLGFDGIQGYSPVALAKNAIGMAIATENFGARFFANSATPGGVLEHPATIRDPATLRYDWESLYQGAGNHRVAILEDGMKFHQLGVEPDKAQFLETRRFQLNEIARIFRVPPHMIGDLERSTFSNIEQQSLEFLKYSVDPWLKRWEQQMEKSLFTPAERKTHEIRFNTKCPFSQKMEPKEE